MLWKKVTLMGVGLLGGSLGMALRHRELAAEVVGFVRRRASVAESKKVGAVDWATTDLGRAVKGADLLVLCTPLGQMQPLMRQLLRYAAPRTIVTDVGSVKASVVRDLEPLAAKANLRFVGSHPMAGSEKTGVRASVPNLYEGSVCVVTPTARTDQDALERIEALWCNVGARVLTLTAEEHDQLVSRSSHLPHLVASCLSKLVLDPGHPSAQALLCANGFRDTTRVASGSPEMWCDIALANRSHLSRALREFEQQLRELKKIVRAEDGEALRQFFTDAKSLRDAWQKGPRSGSME